MDKIKVDRNLNPDNCESLGFKWHQDTIYDPNATQEANDNLIEFLEQGWKLGRPASEELEKNGGVGLYKPSNK